MVTLRDKIQLALFGKPIVKYYKVLTSEKAFREKVKSKLTMEKYLSPISPNNLPLYGQFHGFYERELTLQLTTSIWRRNSLFDSISVHGEMNPLDENSFELKLTAKRSRRKGLSNLVLILFVVIALWLVWNNNQITNTPVALLMTGSLLLFLVSGMAFSFSNIGKQYNDIENYLLSDFDNT